MVRITICVLSLFVLFACVAPQDAAVPAEEVTERRASSADELASAPDALAPADRAPGEDAIRYCCSEYMCPTTGDEYIGCTGSMQTPTQARSKCNAECSANCVLFDQYCIDHPPAP